MGGEANGKHATTAGFTLIEVLVVLGVIGVLLAVTPALLNTLPQWRLEAARAEIAAALKLARGQAVDRGMTQIVEIDPVNRTFSLSSDPRPHLLGRAIEHLELRRESLTGQAIPPRITFFADGSSDGGTIVLVTGGRTRTVAVDWPTGRVRVP